MDKARFFIFDVKERERERERERNTKIQEERMVCSQFVFV